VSPLCGHSWGTKLVVGGSTAIIVLPYDHSSPRREEPSLALHIHVSKPKRPISQMLDKILCSSPSLTHPLPESGHMLFHVSSSQGKHLCSAESNPCVPESMLVWFLCPIAGNHISVISFAPIGNRNGSGEIFSGNPTPALHVEAQLEAAGFPAESHSVNWSLLLRKHHPFHLRKPRVLGCRNLYCKEND